MRHTFPQEKVDNIRGNQTSPDTSCRRAKSSYGGRMLDRTICLVGNIAASTLGVEHHFTIAGAEPRVDLGERPLTRNNCECVPIARSNSEYSERLDSVYHGDQTQNNKAYSIKQKNQEHNKYTDTSKMHNHG